MSGLRSAVAFLTPVGGAARPSSRALAWFPVVGAGGGAAVGAVWWLAAQAWPVPVAAGIAVAADLAVTGLLHVDGLCDSADGLLPPLDRDRRLAVMATPDVGAFGVATCAAVLLLRWLALASIRPSVLLVAGLWALSRTAMAVVTAWVPYARSGPGLASAFRPSATDRVLGPALAAGAVAAVVLLMAWRPVAGGAAAVAAVAAGGAVVALAWRRLGGFTGDVLGAAGVVGETIGLVMACARW